MFKTLFPTLPTCICVHYVCWVLSRYIHIKVGWTIVKWGKDPKLIEQQYFIQDHICLYTHPVWQSLLSLVILTVVNTLITHSHISLIIWRECSKLSLQSCLYVYIYYVCWVWSRYLHVKVGWISDKDTKLITKQYDHICSYTYPVQQSSVITMEGTTLRYSQPYFINHLTWIFQTLTPILPICVYYVCWVWSTLKQVEY